jgi:uncharacterized protein with NRDE domain
MCTVVVLHRASRSFPLVVAANHDEMVARPATTPRRLATPGAPVVACGVDEAQGGTWMGVNDRGLFVGLTNQRAVEPPDPSRRSRGHVVMEALRHHDPSALREHLERLDPRNYNGFNLIYGDGEILEVAYARPEADAVVIEPVPEGIHVLPNDALDSPRFSKVDRARALLGDVGDLSWSDLTGRLGAMLADHEVPADLVEDPVLSRFAPEVLRALQALCIHLPFYGTRSATIAAFEPGGVAHYLFAAGPPCQAPFIEHRHLLEPA